MCFRNISECDLCVYKTPKRKQTGTGDSETLQTTLPWPIAVVKWYRIYADWYKPDPADLGEW